VQFSISNVSGEAEHARKAAMRLPINSLPQTAGSIRELGAYAAVVLIVPGGSLFALSLWAFRHRRWLMARTRRVSSLEGLIQAARDATDPGGDSQLRD
jgi:hypothetical protein